MGRLELKLVVAAVALAAVAVVLYMLLVDVRMRGGPLRVDDAPAARKSDAYAWINTDHLDKGVPAMVEDDRAAEALRWTANLLEEVTARYQVVGGLAARAYGAERGVVDLDLYVDSRGFDRALHRARASRIWGPSQHRDEHWDLRFAKLERRGVCIELADAEGARYFHRTRAVWVDQGIDFSRSEEREVPGVMVAVMPKEQLLDYKRGLARDVDRLDLEKMRIGP